MRQEVRDAFPRFSEAFDRAEATACFNDVNHPRGLVIAGVFPGSPPYAEREPRLGLVRRRHNQPGEGTRSDYVPGVDPACEACALQRRLSGRPQPCASCKERVNARRRERLAQESREHPQGDIQPQARQAKAR